MSQPETTPAPVGVHVGPEYIAALLTETDNAYASLLRARRIHTRYSLRLAAAEHAQDEAISATRNALPGAMSEDDRERCAIEYTANERRAVQGVQIRYRVAGLILDAAQDRVDALRLKAALIRGDV